MIWSGARDLNPGPHGPELCDLSSRNAGNDRLVFEIAAARPTHTAIQGILQLDYYMKYYIPVNLR